MALETGLALIHEMPSVSIVIPIYNRAGFIQACLTSLLAQSYPRERYEIILVDDGSTDGSAAKANVLLQEWDGQFQIIQKTNGGPASARNAGIRVSKADIIAFIDSDCVADPDWLEQIAGCLSGSDAAGVGGPLINIASKTWVSHYLNSTSFFRHRVRHGRVDYLLTANAAFRRAALLAVNGFSEAGVWGEDADLSFRLIQKGHTLLLAKQGIVTHYGTPVSLRGLIKDVYRYGYGNCVLSRNWKNRRTPLVELMRHGGAIVLSPLLALRHLRSAGIGWAIAFWPLIVIEHTAFVLGLLSALRQEVLRGSRCRATSL
jgi:glycosyltransferase involved in cell wall biosynthesis